MIVCAWCGCTLGTCMGNDEPLEEILGICPLCYKEQTLLLDEFQRLLKQLLALMEIK